jgi:hypothetical protein
MLEFFSTWHPGLVLALVAVVGFFLTTTVWVIAGHWSSVRRAEIAADLKRDLIQQGQTIEQIERLLAGPAAGAEAQANEKELEAYLASLMVQAEVSEETLEEVLRIYQATDAGTKQAVYDSLEEILGAEPSEEQLLAAVRALCPPKVARLEQQFTT